MLFDTHTHVFHPKIAHKSINHLENHYDILPKGLGVADDLLARLDKGGLDMAVTFTVATTPGQVVPANNWAIQLAREESRLVTFGTLHPYCEKCESELDRLEAAGIKGIKFHPDFQGVSMDDPAFDRVMEMIGDRFVCLFHVGDSAPPEQSPSCPLKMARLRRKFPEPILIAAHMGGYLHWDYVLEHLGNTDVFFDTSSALPFLGPERFLRLAETLGWDRLLFGSDYPLSDPAEEFEGLRTQLKLSETRMEAMASGIGSLLGL